MKTSSILSGPVAPDRQPVSEKKSTGIDQVKITASAESQQDLFAEEWQMMSEKIAELGPWLMSQPDV